VIVSNISKAVSSTSSHVSTIKAAVTITSMGAVNVYQLQ
jgi:hypothetical protein